MRALTRVDPQKVDAKLVLTTSSKVPMTPQAALEKQIEKYRAMTGEERLKLALDLHELSCQIARDGIHRQHPKADATEVERLLRERIALAQNL
jgi:hypothetical protein